MKSKIIFFLFFASQYCYSQHWDSLGFLNKYPTVLYSDSVSSQLFIGGIFTRINHQIIRGIAIWDGNQLDSVGHGIDYDTTINYYPGNMHGIVRYQNYIYCGGAFTKAGYFNTPYFARWDGVNWSSIPGGRPNDVVENLLVYNNELYVLGVFDSIGNISAHGIAKWNGSIWQTIGNNYDFNNSGMGLFHAAFYNGNLYVSGDFKDPGGNYCRLAKWDGNAWQFLTTDLVGSIAGINDLIVYDNKLFAAGLFFQSAGNAGTSIICWNDTIWSAVGGSVQILSNSYPTISDMSIKDGKLFCVGNFEQIGGIPAMGLATWDGTNWCGYDTDFQNNGQYCGATNIAFYNDTMYVGGGFQTAEGDTVNYIAKWMGGSFVDTCGFLSTEISELNEQIIWLNLFPNPAADMVIFELKRIYVDAEILIFDQFGRQVRNKQADGDQRIEISIADLADGMYFYQYIENSQQRATGKFIVQH